MAKPLIVCLAILSSGAGAEKKPASKVDNKPCYVCHMDLMKEEISQIHIAEEIGCVTCHGPSTHHMHDEMLMTKPDILYGRNEVQGACRKCHDEHENPDRVERFRKRLYGKDRPNGRVINEHSICTDCHGKHNIVKEERKPKSDKENETWTALFDGKTLRPWTGQEGRWQVKRGRIVGLFEKDQRSGISRPITLETFRLYLTFRMTGKQDAAFFWKGKATNKIILSGSAYAAGSLLIDEKLTVLNQLPDALDPEGWNTLSLATDDFLQVWLNGKEVYRVRNRGAPTTEIGLTLNGKEEWASLEIGEVKFQPLKKEKTVN